MIVSLTDRKVEKIRSVCVELLEMEVCSIRNTAEIIGYLVAAHPGVWGCFLCFCKEWRLLKCSSF